MFHNSLIHSDRVTLIELTLFVGVSVGTVVGVVFAIVVVAAIVVLVVIVVFIRRRRRRLVKTAGTKLFLSKQSHSIVD